MFRKRLGNSAFTLIELLIVVAIIAILAAIAVPNFLEAQVRSKVSRVKSDLRTVATAIEAYAVDHQKPPREYCTLASWLDPRIENQDATGIMGPWLSTPVAYITNAMMIDPFVKQDGSVPVDEQRYTYHNMFQRRDRWRNSPSPTFSAAFIGPAILFYGAWRMGSVGPDRDYYNRPQTIANAAQMVYDATNGTVSRGNIWRSQGNSDSVQPSDPALLAAH
jgi:prepilin-type N-terminal cleavage/methylation domain-containing protein